MTVLITGGAGYIGSSMHLEDTTVRAACQKGKLMNNLMNLFFHLEKVQPERVPCF
jgi:UDP-glucose 4-epimerase